MMIPTVMKVFLSDDSSLVVDVPITPNTTALDVIDCCKEPGETNCHLAELWRGKERSVSENEKPYTILQQWGSHAPEVRFCLRHFEAGTNKTNLGFAGGDNVTNGYVAKEGMIMTPSGVEMTLSELKEIAQKQQQQIENQQQTLVGKEQRLRFLKQQMQQQQAMLGENEKLRRLREKAEAQEAKLRKIRALRGRVEQRRYDNTNVSTELEAVKSLFEEKHLELTGAMSKVQDLSNQLDELRKGRMGIQNAQSVLTSGTEKGQNNHSNELDKLRKEMTILNRMNEEQHKRLDEQRGLLKRRSEDAGDLDRRIEDLTLRLRQKKIASGSSSTEKDSKMHTIVAAVEPVVKQTDPKISGPPSKNSPGVYKQDLAYPTNCGTPTSNGIVGRIDQAPGFNRGQPEGSFNQQQGAFPFPAPSHFGDHDKNKSPTVARPQSAMAQLFPTDAPSSAPKPESLTAKVRPMFAKSKPDSPGGYYSLNAKGNPQGSPTKTGGINLFAYKPPPPPTSTPSSGFGSNVTVLPSGNVKYSQQPPPPYPTGVDGGYNPERSITVDIEALRRKFAHAPRPLKKRSSITEPERPQGPNLPKLLYDQIYKKADTPFYRPHLERATPPPAYVEPSPGETPAQAPTNAEGNPPKEESVVSYESNVTPAQFLRQHQQQRSANLPPSFSSQLETIRDEDDTKSPPLPPQQGDDESSEVAAAIKALIPNSSLIPSKGILKPLNAPSKGPNRRIRFDPLALLLDASLEGEFDLVKEIIDLVSDPSGANDEGITALHNAVCAGHFDLVRFLVHYGSDINASDTDGWTPLHCAASCNNLPMARFLVENGACIFAATLSDGETAADKCEELDEGYLPCSEYLYSIQEKLGSVRQGQVYALYDYEATSDDEITFKDGDFISVERKGDENEREWWWSRIGENEGYIPRNLIGMWPRIKAKEDHE